MRLQDNIHWITGTQGCNVYLINTGNAAAVIDGGFLGSINYISAYLRYLGLRTSSLTDILLTHTHASHASAARLLATWSGARITSGPHSGRTLSRTVPHIDRIVGDGDTIEPYNIHIIGIPGHSSDAVAYWLPSSGALAVGDLLVGYGERPLRLGLRIGKWGECEAALAKLNDLPVRVVLPGHGDPVSLSPNTKLMDIIDMKPITPRILQKQLRDMLLGSRCSGSNSVTGTPHECPRL
jgi:glyoxylase-like metal-dependent hydrolase (beta-lactamase superfamily II)